MSSFFCADYPTYTAPHTLAINFPLVPSDGCTQLQSDTTEAHQQGFHTEGHSPQPGCSQPGGHPLLPHTACTQHTVHFPGLLQKLIAEGAFMPSIVEGTLKLSRTTAILLVFQADDQHKKITDIYIGLVVRRIESHLYAPEQIFNFVSDIEVDLKVACNALKAGGDPGKRSAFCLFVNNYGGAMSIPMDLPYCLIYPMSYMKDVELDHFNTCNNPARTHLCGCICRTTLQYMNDDPHHHREYGGSHLILPHRAQYKE